MELLEYCDIRMARMREVARGDGAMQQSMAMSPLAAILRRGGR